MNINTLTTDSTPQQPPEQFWLEQVKLKQESGLSRAAYCRKHNLICSRFVYWERKFASAELKLSQLIPVELKSEVSEYYTPATKCTLMLKGGHELRVQDQSVLPLLISLLS